VTIHSLGYALWPDLVALAQVLFIDLVLAGDNAVVVGLAVAGLPEGQRSRAVLFGVLIAAAVRLALAFVAVRLLTIIGLMLAGGLLLLWVCWRMYRELHARSRGRHARPAPKTMGQALLQVTIADLSMSLDNVLAVAGAAYEHPWVLAIGLCLAVLLMGVAARVVAGLLDRYRWLAWAGLAVVLFVAIRLIWEGSQDVAQHLT
jgi:YjbE family integral membrane protein